MNKSNKKLTELNEWHALLRHHQEIAGHHMRDWFSEDPKRFANFSLSQNSIIFDFSRNRITQETIRLLCELAKKTGLPEKIQALFAGVSINTTEKRPALHTALRNPLHSSITVNGQNIADEIKNTQSRLKDLVNLIHIKQLRGMTGKPFKHIVNIGIGGSHLGPKMATYALKHHAVTDLSFHFISTVDKSELLDVLPSLDPESTLFIISSKSFNTIETLTNAQTIVSWMRNQVGEAVLSRHFIAITANFEKAKNFGIPENHIFPIWDWVGGRYSIWSAIGLPLMLMLGHKQFDAFLQGAHEMDQHFQTAAFHQNMPVLLGLLGIWYMNFFHTKAQAIVPYSHRLRYLVPYLQQAEMESNGKSMDTHGQAIAYQTSPIIFGEEGCNGQHTYHQLLLQGQHLVPIDFIVTAKSHHEEDIHQDILLASALSQSQALMQGKTYREAHDNLLAASIKQEEAKELAKHQAIPGNRPSNILLLESLTPKNLGALLALYEHKIFVQGAIWNINSFDQWGVELGKQILPDVLKQLQSNTETNGITAFIQKLRQIS